jgi:hypothetical protein
MNLKKKLTSVLSLVLALSMLLSSAAMATSLADAEAGSASSSVTEPTEPTEPSTSNPTDPEEPTEPADPEAPTEPTEPTEPTTPATPSEPTEPAANDADADPSPEVMTAAKGWSVNEEGQWSFHYTDLNGKDVVAGDAVSYPSGKIQVLYIPEQVCIVDGETVTRTAGFYAFSEGVWLEDYEAAQVSFYIVEIDLVEGGLAKQKSEDLQYSKKRMMNFTVTDGESKGELYNGARTEVCKAEKNKKLKRRYDDGLPRNSFGLGTDKNLYYYSDGFFQTSVSKGKLYNKTNKGYHLFEGKLYFASANTLTKKKTSPYAAPFTGRWTNSKDGVRRRYEKGVPYTGFGLGTQKTPNLYYYVDGLYQRTKDKHGKVIYNGEKSREEMEAFLGDGKVWNKKLYVATKSTLEGTKTQPYAVPLTGYRMVNNKMYKYTKGTPVLFTGIYNGTETNLAKYKGYYFSKGVKQKLPDGWKPVGGKRYYIKNGKYVTGWNYIKYNGATYRYFFDKTGAQVQDLFSYNRAYMKSKMLVQINRYTHTTDVLLYNSATKKYDIPAKSFVTSTPKEAAHFKVGSYKLDYRRRWWSFFDPTSQSYGYYQYAIRIKGTPAALLHSSRYYAKRNNALKVSNYNNLGTNQSYYCIRVQCVNSKLLYDCVGKQGAGKIKCKYTNSKTPGPNGKVTLADTTGKLKKSAKYDPTDPAAK